MARRIVVVGGGVIGCSVAWHLACRDAGEIVLVERDRLGAGTTWHSAGNILWNPIDMHDLPILYMLDEVIPQVTAEAEQETGWLETGRLFLARTQRTLESFTAQAEEGARRGFVSRMLESHEIPQHHPLLDPGVLTGAWLNGKVGRLNPADLTAAYARAARKRGVTILEQRNVQGIETQGERVTGVATDQGRLAADTVLVCCGLCSRRLRAPLGLDGNINAITADETARCRDQRSARNVAPPSVGKHEPQRIAMKQMRQSRFAGIVPEPDFGNAMRHVVTTHTVR